VGCLVLRNREAEDSLEILIVHNQLHPADCLDPQQQHLNRSKVVGLEASGHNQRKPKTKIKIQVEDCSE
jgi:hypothetical protein